MDLSFKNYTRIVNEYILNDPEKFKKIIAAMGACRHAKDKLVAGAIGYLIAMEEKPYKDNSIYEKVLEQVQEEGGDSMTRTDAIMTAVYCWLDKEMKDDGYEENDEVRDFLLDRFTPYIVSSNLDRT